MTAKMMRMMFVVCTFMLSACVNIAYGQAQQTDNVVLQPIDIVIPGPLDGNRVRNPFVEDLLRLVFSKQGYDLNIVYFKRNYNQARALKELSQGINIDLNWSTTSIEREQELRAIRFPLYRGLIGWRVAFIRHDDQTRFSDISSAQDLREFIAVQRFDWTDFDVFRENDLPIEGNFSFKTMSKAVASGLADYFPRSVLEINNESIQSRNKDLVVEKTLLIKYPSAYYFFVNKENEELAITVESGLKKAFADGSYQVLFNRHFGNTLGLLKLDERKIIELTNSTFPDSEKVEQFWFK